MIFFVTVGCFGAVCDSRDSVCVLHFFGDPVTSGSLCDARYLSSYHGNCKWLSLHCLSKYSFRLFQLYLSGYLLTFTYAKTSDAPRIVSIIRECSLVFFGDSSSHPRGRLYPLGSFPCRESRKHTTFHLLFFSSSLTVWLGPCVVCFCQLVLVAL